ncbi:cysteine-rich CWC family protein [Enterovibrio norvegicus]|uniref:Cysteine-rich CWC family protein n=1 Tax=Enterovibrio norvegicus TaxID=188144 RepID=A0ABV4L4V7_9GAMM|nr:cysteine-rich CWC family protein [Enterovibrio norvegicus]
MTSCPQCNAPLTCTADTGACWCMQYPHILPVADKNNLACLCPRCLAKRINQELDVLYQEYSVSDLIRLAKPYANSPELIEGLDYTMENGFMVFSAWYHLKRGTCCGNGCRHCPYGKSDTSRFNNVG